MKQENFFERKKLRTVIITNSVTVNRVSSNTLRDARNHALHDFVPEFSFFFELRSQKTPHGTLPVHSSLLVTGNSSTIDPVHLLISIKQFDIITKVK